MTDRASPEIENLIAAAIESAFDNVHVSLPGIVQSYDAATQTCSVQPAVRRPIMNEDDELVFEEYAIITNVPVVFPGSAALSFHFALQKGDSVELVWQDFSFAGWRNSGNVSDAGDTRKHGSSYPVAIPWMRPKGKAGPDTDNSVGIPGGLRIHFATSAVSVGAGSDFVAMSSKTNARLSALESGMTTHTHVVAGTLTPPTTVAGAAAPSTDSGVTPGASVASMNLKAE